MATVNDYTRTTWQTGDVIDATKMNNIETQLDAVTDNARENGIAPVFSTTKTYAVGEHVLYNGEVYRCKTAVASAGAWVASNWTKASLSEDLEGEVSELKSAFDNVNFALGAVDVKGDPLTRTDNDAGCYWRNVDGTWQRTSTSATKYWHVETYDVISGRKYSVTGDMYHPYVPVCIYLDTNNNILGSTEVPSDSTWQREEKTYDVTIPADCTKIYVNKFYLDFNATVCLYTTEYELPEDVEEAVSKANAVLNMFKNTVIDNPYVSGQVNVTDNNLYFPDNIIPAKSILKNISFFIGASLATSNVKLGIWELSDDGATLTKKKEKEYTNLTANATLSIDLNEYYEKRRMISVTKANCYIFLSNDPVVGNGLLYSSDNTITSVNVSDLTSAPAQKLTFSMTYTSADNTKYYKPYETRITTANYASILPDFNDAPYNVIYDIFQCLHSIANCPSDIPSNLTSATFFSFKGGSDSNNWDVQFLVPNGTSTRVFVRNYMDNSWKAWKELGAIPQDANLLSLDYYNATSVNKIEIGSIQSKNILTFGDSITAGNTDTSWTYHFANMTGSTIVNRAVAGASFGESTAESTSKYISTQISGVSSAEWEAADLIIVSAGTNDGLINTPHAELKEKVQAAITAIKAATNKPIVFITPIRRNTPDYAENLKLPLIAGIISNVALMNQCNVICGYNFPIPSQTIDQITNVTRDGLHPNATGANIYARAVINALT